MLQGTTLGGHHMNAMGVGLGMKELPNHLFLRVDLEDAYLGGIALGITGDHHMPIG